MEITVDSNIKYLLCNIIETIKWFHLQKQDVSCFTLLLDGMSHKFLGRLEHVLTGIGKDCRQENIGRFEIAEVAAKISLNSKRHFLFGRWLQSLADRCVNHFYKTVEISEPKVLALLPLVHLAVAVS